MIMFQLKHGTKNGIYLANVTDYCPEEVSDQALGLMMACARKIARRDAQVRAGEWNIGQKDPIYRIAGKTFYIFRFWDDCAYTSS